MIVTTTELASREYEILGLVSGSIVTSKHIGRDIGAAFKGLVGGELKGYTEMLEDARKEAYSRMLHQARELSADAVVSMRITTSSIIDGASEVLVYGTAVKFL